jgi:tetratricopeptide (TPR) repeat protein
MIFAVFSGCTGSPAVVDGVSLEDGIVQVVRDIETGLPEGRRIIPAKIPSKKTPVLATLYFNSGLAYYEAGRYAEAIAEFTHALEIREDDAASLRYREDSYYYLRAQFCCGI